MRWSIIRVIWMRELRDQLRDRRTVLMIVVLPLLIYPLGALGLMQIAPGLLPRQSIVGVTGVESLPHSPFPALIVNEDGDARFSLSLFPSEAEQAALRIRLLDADSARAALDARQVDVVLEVPPGFHEALKNDSSPTLTLLSRPGDRSLLARVRISQVLDLWRMQINEVRFASARLRPRFDAPFLLFEPGAELTVQRPAAEIIFDVLVLWSLAGALYPAVDVCAGEKERGTMETLLISPAQREEIVWGKFLTIWVFSGITALLNLVSMGITSWLFGG